MKKANPKVGLRDLVYALLTSDTTAGSVYSTVKEFAPALKAALKVNLKEGSFYADDVKQIEDKQIQSIDVSIDVSDLTSDVRAEVLGHTIDSKGGLIENEDDKAPEIALGFRAKKADGTFEYTWLYKGVFGDPSDDYETQKEGYNYQVQTIEGSFMPRLSDGNIRYKINSGEAGVDATVIANWFTAVAEPNGGTPLVRYDVTELNAMELAALKTYADSIDVTYVTEVTKEELIIAILLSY